MDRTKKDKYDPEDRGSPIYDPSFRLSSVEEQEHFIHVFEKGLLAQYPHTKQPLVQADLNRSFLSIHELLIPSCQWPLTAWHELFLCTVCPNLHTFMCTNCVEQPLFPLWFQGVEDLTQ